MADVLIDKAIKIRKITALDFNYVRKLPVQLTHPGAGSLLPKQLRLMMQAGDQEPVVLQKGKETAGFIAMRFSPARDSGIRFLVIQYMAVDRFALANGLAAELEAYACSVGESAGCTAVLVSATALSNRALKFYGKCGYALNGEVLLKPIS